MGKGESEIDWLYEAGQGGGLVGVDAAVAEKNPVKGRWSSVTRRARVNNEGDNLGKLERVHLYLIEITWLRQGCNWYVVTPTHVVVDDLGHLLNEERSNDNVGGVVENSSEHGLVRDGDLN